MTERMRKKIMRECTRTTFLDMLSKIHLTLDIMEDQALELPTGQRIEIHLALQPIQSEVEKINKVVESILRGGFKDA